MLDRIRHQTRWMLPVVAIILVAGCGGGSKSSGRTVAPGHGSPEAAVAGIMTGIAQNQASIVCSYVTPSSQATCTTALTTTPVSVARWAIGKSYVFGDQALVVVLVDRLCTGQCLTNTDPGKGLPRNNGDFARAYAATAGNSSDPAVQCAQVNGQWYANFG